MSQERSTGDDLSDVQAAAEAQKAAEAEAAQNGK